VVHPGNPWKSLGVFEKFNQETTTERGSGRKSQGASLMDLRCLEFLSDFVGAIFARKSQVPGIFFKNNLVNNGGEITNFNWLASRISELPTVVLDFVSLTF